MPDPRDVLLRDIHLQWLKPVGFRKIGRRCQVQFESGLIVSVVLESGSSYQFGPTSFGFELCAMHPSFDKKQTLIILDLPRHSEKFQRWTYEYGAPTDDLFTRIKLLFSQTGLPLLERMCTLESLAELFTELDSVWHYRGHAWCLDSLDRPDEATQVVERAISRAPHDNFRQFAMRELEVRKARGAA
jgi:hypothetical protein